jgi:hypothetical protein
MHNNLKKLFLLKLIRSKNVILQEDDCYLCSPKFLPVFRVLRYAAARLEILAEVLLKIEVLWSVTLCRCVNSSRRLEAPCCLNFLGPFGESENQPEKNQFGDLRLDRRMILK